MKIRGRYVDPIQVWEKYVEFPPNMDMSGPYLSLVKCPNPNHHTEKRHFQINISEPLVHCFAECGISGTYENAIRLIEGCDARQARKIIFGRGNSRRTFVSGELHKRVVKSTSSRVATSVPDLSTYSYLPTVAIEYLQSRGISESSRSEWDLGWNSDSKRVTIPVRDGHGKLCFVIERAVGRKQLPRYLYPEGSAKTEVLFGLDKIDLRLVRSFGLVLVEGSIDTIRLHQHGLTTTGGILGAKLSRRQSEIIARMRPRRIYTFFDRDSSGISATRSVKGAMPSTPIYVCRYVGEATDPAEMSREEAIRAVVRAIPYAEFNNRVHKLNRGV